MVTGFPGVMNQIEQQIITVAHTLRGALLIDNDAPRYLREHILPLIGTPPEKEQKLNQTIEDLEETIEDLEREMSELKLNDESLLEA